MENNIKKQIWYQVMFKLSILALITVIIIGCSKDEQNNTNKSKYSVVVYKWINEYPEFYSNPLKYEIDNNLKSINTNIIYNVLKNDSCNLMKMQRINLKSKDSTILIVKERRHNNNLGLIIYKQLEQYYYEKNCKIVQYEYPLSNDSRRKIVIFGIEYLDKQNESFCCYVSWSSTPVNVFKNEKTPKLTFYNYMWGINKSTDTITSNLSLNNIKSLYPEFEGIYIFKKYSSLVLNHEFPSNDLSFYSNIEFID